MYRTQRPPNGLSIENQLQSNLLRCVERTRYHSRLPLCGTYSSKCHGQRYRTKSSARILMRFVDWLNASEPRGPRPIVKTFTDEIRKIDEECSKFMRPGVRPAKSTRSGSMRIDTLSQRSTLNIQRLFTDKIEIYDTVQSTTISVTSGIIKIALKAMLESVRLKTFSSYGLQQIQGTLVCLQSVLYL